MAGTGKVIAIMAGSGLVVGAGATAIAGARGRKKFKSNFEQMAQSGQLGPLDKDTMQRADKDFKKSIRISAIVTGILAAAEVAAVSALALLAKAKLK